MLSVCTYNCNGLASVKQYAASNTIAGVLQQLGADIVCFQETKLSRPDLWPVAFQRIAEVPAWDACFCFTRKSGYSGVATYSRSAVTTVRAAEEGLLRVLPPQNPVCAATMHVAESAAAAAGVGSQAAAGSAGWPREIVFPAQQLHAMFTAEEALAVDKDGRCIITDHGLFVLFNCYFPACTGNNALQQIQVKHNMWRAVEVRMRALLANGRHVVLAGDFNVSLPWWGQEGTGAGRVRLMCLSTIAAARLQSKQGSSPAQQEKQQVQQLESSNQEQQGKQAVGQGQGHGSHGPDVVQLAESSGAVEDLPAHLQQQPGDEDDSAQQPAQQLMGAAGGAKEGSKFAPHAQYTRGKPVLPSSGLAEALIALTTPAEQVASSVAPSTTLPTAGVLIDTLKHLNPGVQMFRHWDQKKGQYKERLPYTAWSPMWNIRNDQTGARSDYIFVADAAEYAALLQKLPEQQHTQPPLAAVQEQGQPAASLAPHLPQQQGQQQQDALSQEAFSISMRGALSSAFILRELRWTDHAPVVLQLRLPPSAAGVLRSPAADAALQAVTPHLQQQQPGPQPQPLAQMQQQPGLHSQPQSQRPAQQPLPHSHAQQQPEPQAQPQMQYQQQLLLQSVPPLQAQQDQPLALPSHTAHTATALLSMQDPPHDHPTNSQAAPAPAHTPATPSPSGVPAELPCPLSSHWILQPAAAAATASAVLAAAGVDRVPTAVLTCSTIHELRQAQYAAATAAIAARAEQLYASEDNTAHDRHEPSQPGATTAALPSAGSGSSTGVDGVPGGAAVEAAVALGLPSPVLQLASAAATDDSSTQQPKPPVPARHSTQPAGLQQQQGTQQHSSAGAQVQAAGQGTATQGVPLAHRHPKQQGQQHVVRDQRGRQQQQRQVGKGSSPPTPALCGKRKGRGWKVVRMSNGRTATVACSSSDSEG